MVHARYADEPSRMVAFRRRQTGPWMPATVATDQEAAVVRRAQSETSSMTLARQLAELPR